MKELIIEQKAKQYDEAFERAKKLKETCDSTAVVGWCEYIFPELKEREDKMWRNWLIGHLEGYINLTDDKYAEVCKKAIAWLKKQGEQKDILENVVLYSNEDGLIADTIRCKIEKQGEQKYVPDWMPKFLDELRSKKNYFGWDEHRDFEGGIVTIINWMNPNYFNEKDGEQKPADKVEPKFKIGDKIQYLKGCGTIMTIEKIENGEYIFGNNLGHTTIESGNKWHLVEQTSAWSKEDENMLDTIIDASEHHCMLDLNDID